MSDAEPRLDEARWSMERLRSFAVFQLIFWGANFVIRTLAAVEHRPEYALSFIPYRLLAVTAGIVITTAIFLILLRFDHWTQPKRMALAFFLCLATLWPTNALERTLAGWAGADLSGITFLNYILQFGWIYFMWAGYYFALDLTHRTKRHAENFARAQALAHSAQLQMLRHQLNPHFLFNSLNAISSLVLDRRNADAEAMLLNLSRFLRRVAEPSPNPLAILRDEAEVQRMYLEVEAVRFGEKLQVACNVSEQLGDCLVPTLLLQPVVENAIKHGIAKLPQGGWIYIDARRVGDTLRLSVENDGPALPKSLGQTEGIGIRNTRERLQVLYGAKAWLKLTSRPNGGARVEICLPFATAPAADEELLPA